MADHKNLLLDLPPELTEAIATDTSEDDLLNLRLVSREVAARTSRAMLKANFTELHVLFCVPSSLQRGLAVAKHPLLKKALHSVTIYQPRFTEELLSELQSWQAKDRAGRATHRAAVERYTKCLAEQNQQIETNSDRAYITEIFSELKSTTQGVSIAIRDFTTENPKDWHRLASRADFEGRVDGHWPDERAICVVLDAVLEANVQVDQLSVGWGSYFSDEACAIRAATFAGSHGFDAWGKNFSLLTSFKLVLDGQYGQQRDDSDSVDNILRLLRASSDTLKALHFSQRISKPSFTRSWNSLDEVILRLSREPALRCLASLDIECLHTDYQRLISFLAKHKSTLKDYCLSSIWAKNSGPWLSRMLWEQKVDADLRAVGLPPAAGFSIGWGDLDLG